MSAKQGSKDDERSTMWTSSDGTMMSMLVLGDDHWQFIWPTLLDSQSPSVNTKALLFLNRDSAWSCSYQQGLFIMCSACPYSVKPFSLCYMPLWSHIISVPEVILLFLFRKIKCSMFVCIIVWCFDIIMVLMANSIKLSYSENYKETNQRLERNTEKQIKN